MFCVRLGCWRLRGAPIRDISASRPTRTIIALMQRCSSAMWLPSPSLLHSARTPPATAAPYGTPSHPLHQAALLPERLPAASRTCEPPTVYRQSLNSRSSSTAISASSQELAPPASARGSGSAGALRAWRAPAKDTCGPPLIGLKSAETESRSGASDHWYTACHRIRSR